MPTEHPIDFLAFHGGPFYELQRRFHLNALSVGRRSILFVGLAWLVPSLISVAEGMVWGAMDQWSFLRDPTTWARFLIAVGLFLLAERTIERQLRVILAQFWNTPILAPASFEEATRAVTRALAARDSPRAEIICALLAIAAALAAAWHLSQAPSPSSWTIVDDGPTRTLSLTAWWCLLVSYPIFWFLFLRSCWRHHVWASLLRELSRLDLRLAATHPDGKGGLAFVGDYPNAFTVFVFGISCVVGAVLGHHLLYDEITATTYGSIVGAWLVLVFAFFSYPLIAFTRPLVRLKESALLLSATQATNYHRSAERKLLGRNAAAKEQNEGVKDGDLPDPSKFYDSAKKMSVYLLNRRALIPVAAAAVLPLAAAGAAKLPYDDILALVKKLLLL